MSNHVFKVLPESEAEQYFVKDIMPHCKDRVICRLGVMFGRPWNEYEITHDDYDRCQKFIKVLKGESQ